tara:strand:- start:244 stop:522 length:279 start_codon:yes stop_codon:yes gene_type:complete
MGALEVISEYIYFKKDGYSELDMPNTIEASLDAGGKKYFFDVMETKAGYVLKIKDYSKSKKKGTSIEIWEDRLESFIIALNQMKDAIDDLHS